ncbi:Citronellol and citronellal dehydrogenase [Labilithrix luteola]|uniref:Peroxisomal trans-2-enoyl-CoA reductase n=1 Tax=Labilithrix luteola TaxID=1391654 RepID=A0A0K1PS15_9BACT|nr:SDR family oxidoreductase [Labilithrix luteola]AKU96307.1 Citronellol and citronellal dehydrogenase [Labilithrix luteola]
MPSIFRKDLFQGQVAIVTGGGSGIGLATATTLGELGAKIAICGRKKEKLDAAAETLAKRGIEVFADACDIREMEQVTAFVAAVKEKLGTASVLVNNAGGQFPTTAETVSARGWEAVVRNNLNGTFFMTQSVANLHMIPAKRGRVVNVIANVARGFPGMVHTGAARAGVENMTKTLAIEWAQYNVQVNAVAPGVIRTSGTDQYPPELLELSRERTPMKRLGTAGEVAQLIAYLASDAAFFVTGVTWYIDGGAHLWGDNWIIADAEPPPPPAIVAELAKE